MARRGLVLYDGSCPLCVSSVERLRTLDWVGRLSFADVRAAEVRAAHPDLDETRARERMQLLPPDGRTPLEGFHAVRWIAGRVPLLWIVWPLLWIPGAARVGVPLYDAVARNRFAFAKCKGSDCPAHERGD